jgi:hypothetical protein
MPTEGRSGRRLARSTNTTHLTVSNGGEAEMTVALLARSKTDAEAKIAEAIQECAEGQSDYEVPMLALAKLWGGGRGSRGLCGGKGASR